MTTLLLGRLSSQDPLRNRPLGKIGAQVRNLQSSTWRDLAAWYIARCTFNELGDAWTDTNEFRVTVGGVASRPSGGA